MARDMYHGFHLGRPLLFEAPGIYTNTSPDFVYGMQFVLLNANMGLDYWSGPMLSVNAQLTGENLRAAYSKLAEFVTALRKSFSPRNFAREVVQRQTDCVLGREPDWIITGLNDSQLKVVSEWAKQWWRRSKAHEAFLAAGYQAAAEGRAVVEIGVMPGALDDQGTIRRSDLRSLARLIRLSVIPPETVQVGTDDKADPYAVRLITDGRTRGAQLVCLDDQGNTVMRVWQGDDDPVEVVARLGGRLTVFEMSAPALLSDTFLSGQRAYNTGSTMISRNTELAGWVERYGINLVPPQVETANGGKIDLLQTGPGNMSLFYSQVHAVEDADGNTKPFPMPNAQYGRLNPVSPEPIKLAVEHAEQGMLGEARQTHTLLNKDGSANARSREVAAADFTNSLMPLERSATDVLAQALEAAICLLGHFTGEDYSTVKVDVRCRVQPVPPTVQERAMALAEAEVGAISLNTQRAWIGILDGKAEDTKIAEERALGISPTLIPSKVAGGSVRSLLAALDKEQAANQIPPADPVPTPPKETP